MKSKDTLIKLNTELEELGKKLTELDSNQVLNNDNKMRALVNILNETIGNLDENLLGSTGKLSKKDIKKMEQFCSQSKIDLIANHLDVLGNRVYELAEGLKELTIKLEDHMRND